MCYSMTGFSNPVILVTPVITAIGCDDWGDGNPEEQRQAPWAFTHQRGSLGISGRVTARKRQALMLAEKYTGWIPEQARE